MRSTIMGWLAVLTFSALPSVATAAGLASAEDATARGLLMRYFPERGYVYIREYSLAGDATRETVEPLVSDASWCDEHFNFELLESVEERAFAEGDTANVECHLVTRSDDVAAVMQDLLSGVLDRPVGAGLADGELRASFDFPEDDVELDQHNAEGLFLRKNRRAMMIWTLPQEKFEAVWVNTQWSGESLLPVVSPAIASPALSGDEFKARKKAARAK